jgi:hypothetical protein
MLGTFLMPINVPLCYFCGMDLKTRCFALGWRHIQKDIAVISGGSNRSNYLFPWKCSITSPCEVFCLNFNVTSCMTISGFLLIFLNKRIRIIIMFGWWPFINNILNIQVSCNSTWRTFHHTNKTQYNMKREILKLLTLFIMRFGHESREDGSGDPSRWPRDTLYQQNLVLTSPTSGGRLVGIVLSRTKATGFIFLLFYSLCSRLKL